MDYMSLFDYNKVLKIVDNDKGMAVTLLSMFVEQAKEDQSKLIQYFNDADVVMLGKVAHKMKSSLSTLGMQETSDRLKNIELAAKNNVSIDELNDNVQQSISDLEQIYKEINVAISS